MNTKKKVMFLIFALVMLTVSLTADGSLIRPVDPATLGRGSTGITDPGSYQSFFYNPAGFALADQFTAFSVNPWLFTDMNTVKLLNNPSKEANDIIDSMQDNNEIQTKIDQWLATKTDQDLAAILAEEGYTQQDIIDAGGPENFVDGLTQEELIAIIGLVMEEEDFPVQPADIGLPSGAARAGLSTGIAFTRGGLGLGMFAVIDANIEGQNILSAEGYAAGQLTIHAGYAQTIDLGILKLHVGAQVRPTLTIHTPIDSSYIPTVINSGADAFTILKTMDGLKQAGIGFDAGAIVELGWIKAGLSVTDLLGVHDGYFGTMMSQESVNLGDLLDDPSNILPQGEDYAIYPMSFNFGVGFNPSIPGLNKVLDPYIYADFQNLNGVIEAARNLDKYALLDLIKVGADVKVLSFINARAGYADGYFTLGAGLDLFFVEANVAATFGTLQVEDISDFGITGQVSFKL